MKYFKIIHKETGEVMCYGNTTGPVTEDLCGIFGDEYTTEECTVDEYLQETGDEFDA